MGEDKKKKSDGNCPWRSGNGNQSKRFVVKAYKAPTAGLENVVFKMGTVQDASDFEEHKKDLGRYVAVNFKEGGSMLQQATEAMVTPTFTAPADPTDPTALPPLLACPWMDRSFRRQWLCDFLLTRHLFACWPWLLRFVASLANLINASQTALSVARCVSYLQIVAQSRRLTLQWSVNCRNQFTPVTPKNWWINENVHERCHWVTCDREVACALPEHTTLDTTWALGSTRVSISIKVRQGSKREVFSPLKCLIVVGLSKRRQELRCYEQEMPMLSTSYRCAIF